MKKAKEEQISRRRKIAEKARESARKLKTELRKSVLTAIVAAFGFLIALSWRDVIKELVESLAKISPIQGKIISAMIITIISVIGILIITKFLSEEGKEDG